MLCFGHADGATIEEAVAALERRVGEGYRAVRLQAGVPGLRRVYGVPVEGGSEAQTGTRMAADGGALPAEGDWDTAPYLRHATRLFAAARARVGDAVHLLHDVHHRLTPNEAAQLGKALEPYGLFWLEDATPAENQEALRHVRRHTTTPLAVGEVFNSLHDCRALIAEQLIDFIRAAVCHAGGITHLRRIADYAAIWGVRTGCHGAADLSPVTMAAALHFGRWVPNFGIQEYAVHPPESAEVFRWDWRFESGVLHSGEAPGLGVSLDERAAARFPYRRAYLDVNRLTDGTLWDW
jgi:mannonate dehydratase